MNNKTVLSLIFLGAVSFVATISVIVSLLIVNATQLDGIVPLEKEGMLGASVTTIQGSDKIKDSRVTINTNFASLNTDKQETASTSLPNVITLPALTTANALTSASSLATVGTLTTGTWNADTLTVAYGGTGSSTLTLNAVLLGNSTNGIKGVQAGTEDQVLTLKSGLPTWTSGSVDETLSYDWTGEHSWTTGTTTFNSLSTFTASTTANYMSLENDPEGGDNAVRKSYADSNYTTKYYSGVGTYTVDGASENDVFAHGLGVTPSHIRVSAMLLGAVVSASIQSNGTYDGSLYKTSHITNLNVGKINTSNVVFLEYDDASDNEALATATLDSTNVTLAFNSDTNEGDILTYLIEAWAY